MKRIWTFSLQHDLRYDGWYQKLRAVKLADVAKELEVTTDQFALCLGLCWSPDVNCVDFRLEENVIVEPGQTIGEMTLNEVLALMFAFVQQRFVAGLVMILTELIAECSLEHFLSYLVMARGDMIGLLEFAKLLKRKDAQGNQSSWRR